eukprot:CAMPEP_0179197100 /NCGR_PEP_ID=MMETSP0796-20121207/98014_1 /TAXON_ID=73915 /ORGANISM="Pyrodinium bahamense, Strain pbaha01" /LENGTH=394 /DNA_ID=CAMNT_0020901517 /DNA_START=23 /DNA_END=1204 /DNA_ORIENTATION=-
MALPCSLLREGPLVKDMPREGTSEASRAQGPGGEVPPQNAALTSRPLDVVEAWCRHARWAAERQPAVEASRVLERACRALASDSRHRDDVRHLRLWVRHASTQPRPERVMSFLEDAGIGTKHALLYEALANALELRRCFPAAEAAYRRGLERGAQPRARLERALAAFKKRMRHRVRRYSQGLLGAHKVGNTLDVSQRLEQFPSSEPRAVTEVHCKPSSGTSVAVSEGSAGIDALTRDAPHAPVVAAAHSAAGAARCGAGAVTAHHRDLGRTCAQALVGKEVRTGVMRTPRIGDGAGCSAARDVGGGCPGSGLEATIEGCRLVASSGAGVRDGADASTACRSDSVRSRLPPVKMHHLYGARLSRRSTCRRQGKRSPMQPAREAVQQRQQPPPHEV